MSNPYPSRRELRLQREREQRTILRDEEAQRWANEVEHRQLRPAELETTTQDADEPTAAETTATLAVADDNPDETPVQAEQRQIRRADSAVTSTGMLPIISKPRVQRAAKPRSRREARQQEARNAAARRAELERLEREQGQPAEEKVVRRATSPQLTPPPVPVDDAVVATADEPTEITVVPAESEQPSIEIVGSHEPTAAEITDMSGLDTIEIRRAELRAETERLTQEIIELGESNPNVIDPQLLRRQKELAVKSRELQELETAAIEIVESTRDDDATTSQHEVALDVQTEADTTFVDDAPESASAAADVATSPAAPEQSSGRRGRRRSTTGPFVSGPFTVDEDPAEESSPTKAGKKPPLSDFLRPLTDDKPKTEPRQPIDATSAHGLDTLDAKDVEAPERRIMTSAVVMFAIGIIALIIAIILFTR